MVKKNNPITRVLSGTIRPIEFSQLSFQVAGNVSELTAQVGDEVQKLQQLASIDQQAFELKVRQASAGLNNQQAQLKQRHDRFLRQQRLFTQQLINQQAFEQALSEFEQAKTLVEQAKVSLQLAQRDLANTKLRAPFSGIITSRYIEPFQDIKTGQAIFSIQNKQHLEVAFLVPSNLFSHISRGQRVKVSLSDTSTPINATIEKIGVDAELSGAFPVSATLESNHSFNVQAGMTANVSLSIVERKESITVPESAVVITPSDTQQVFVYDAQAGVVRAVTVQSEISNTHTVKITSGLNGGEHICIAGAELLSAGQQVPLYQLNEAK